MVKAWKGVGWEMEGVNGKNKIGDIGNTFKNKDEKKRITHPDFLKSEYLHGRFSD